jgi:hypothetical protein
MTPSAKGWTLFASVIGGLILVVTYSIYDPPPSFDVPLDLKVGMTIADLGRLHPKSYSIEQDQMSMERLKKTRPALRQNFLNANLPAQAKKFEYFTGLLMDLKMDGTWDKILHIRFVNGRIVQIFTEVERCSVCD